MERGKNCFPMGEFSHGMTAADLNVFQHVQDVYKRQTYYSYYSADGSSSGENADASSMKKGERSGKAKELAATQSHDSEDLY